MAFARGKEAMKRKAAKATRRKMLGTKPVGASAVRKGPARNKSHLLAVRSWSCIVCDVEAKKGWIRGQGKVQAHHVRCIAPRTMGVRVSDYLAVPLCEEHHRMLHSGNEYRFWYNRHIKPAEWIAQFSPEGAAEIAAISRKV